MAEVGTLEKLLEEERHAILSGDFRVLPALAARKARALAGTVRTGLDPAGADRLTKGLERNQRLMKAALRGMREARTPPPITPETCGTYDREGVRAQMASPNGAFERKA